MVRPSSTPISWCYNNPPSVGQFAFSDPGIYHVIGGWLPGAVLGWCHLWQRLYGGLQRLAQRPGAHADPCGEDHHRRLGSSVEPWDVDTIHPYEGFPSHGGTPKTLDGESFMENTMKMWMMTRGTSISTETSISYHCHWTFDDFWKGAIRLKQEPGPCRSILAGYGTTDKYRLGCSALLLPLSLLLNGSSVPRSCLHHGAPGFFQHLEVTIVYNSCHLTLQ